MWPFLRLLKKFDRVSVDTNAQAMAANQQLSPLTAER